MKTFLNILYFLFVCAPAALFLIVVTGMYYGIKKYFVVLLFSSTAASSQLVTPAEATLQLISGAADGTNQAIAHHHLGQGNRFWDYDNSWKNKYKDWPDDKREAYPGSKTVLVFLSDGFHLTRFIDRAAMTASIVIAVNSKKNWKYILKKAIVLSVINRLSFTLFYNVIFKV